MLAWKFNHCLERIRSGDIRWIEDIYNEYYERMTLTAYNKIKNIETAKDIASDFILYILKNAKEIGKIEYPDSWIFSAIKNKSVDFIRKNSRTSFIEELNEECFAANINYDFYCALNKDLDDLTESEQELALMRFIYGLKYREISRKIGKPIGTLKSDISKIKKKFPNLSKYI